MESIANPLENVDQGMMNKMEKDFSEETKQKIQQARDLCKQNKLEDAIENVLLPLEKLTRLAADMPSTSLILEAIVELCFEGQRWTYLNDNMTLLAKKRSLIKASISKMIKKAFTYVEKTPTLETKIALIECLRDITDGKIYVEMERAWLTLKLAHIRERQNRINDAATVLQDLQVETFGSMDRIEKVEFILEQMRLCLANKDIIRAQIISKKISTRFFTDKKDDEAVQKLKLKFYRLMSVLKSEEEEYLNVANFYNHMLDTGLIQANDKQRIKATKAVLLNCLLAVHGPDQVSLLNKTHDCGTIEDDLPQYKRLAKIFLDSEIIEWLPFCEMYETELLGRKQQNAMEVCEDDQLTTTSCTTIGPVEVFAKNSTWATFKTRVIEHNLRVIAKYYTRITMKRLCELLDVDQNSLETDISRLVNDGMINCKIDRLGGLVDFRKKTTPREQLNEWGTGLESLMGLVNQTTHLISKEYILANAKIGAN